MFKSRSCLMFRQFDELTPYPARYRSRFCNHGLLLRSILLFSFCLLPFAFASAQDYSKFLHSSQKHASLSCNDCHRRADNSARPSFPGHKACTGCHLGQFTTPNIPMCSICHQNVNGSDPPRKAFPDRFNENFNVKFDHAQHMTGAARPRNGCVSCHSGSVAARRGACRFRSECRLTTTVTVATPRTRKPTVATWRVAACATIRSLTRGLRRTQSPSAMLFVTMITATRQRLNCSDCHSYTRGLPQKRQVSSTRAQEHFPTGHNTCATCHNGQRSFGGDLDFKGCRSDVTRERVFAWDKSGSPTVREGARIDR